MAQRLLSTSDLEKSVFLISSDSRGEGAFISEVAMGEQRPGHIVQRASKVLSKSSWNGTGYQFLFDTEEDMLNYLAEVPVGIVILEESVPAWLQKEHHRRLKKALEGNSQQWVLLGNYSLLRGGRENPKALKVYRQVGHEGQAVGTIKLDMREMLNKFVEGTYEK